MNTEKLNCAGFWSVIASTAGDAGVDRRPQVERICRILETFTLKELAAFKKCFNREIKRAYTFEMMVAAFVINSYLSDDIFLEFRSWVVLHGRHTFTSVIRNPDILADLITRREVDKISSAGFPELPTKIWLDRGGSLKAYIKTAGFVKDPKVATPWPKSKEDFRSQFPILYDAFWNERRIKALHKT